MQEPNFFQSKLALAKAFPGRRLPMTKLQQLYREIYNSGAKRKVLNLIREENAIGVFKSEGSIYNHKDMDKLLDQYMDFDREMQYYAEALNTEESPTSPTKGEKAGADRKSTASFVPASFDQGMNLMNFNLQKIKESERLVTNPSSPSQSLHISSSNRIVGKQSSLPISPKANPNWPKEFQQLHDSIERHAQNKSSQRKLERRQSHFIKEVKDVKEESPTKNNLTELNNHLKSYIHRLGLEHHKSVMEEAKEIAKYSNRSGISQANMTGISFFKEDKSTRLETNPSFGEKKLERNMSIFSKERRETIHGDVSPKRSLSIFSKGKRAKKLSEIPSLKIPSLNLGDKTREDRSPSPDQQVGTAGTFSNLSPDQKYKSYSQVSSPLLQLSPLLSKNHSPTGTSTNFFLPKLSRKSQKAVSLSLSQPKNKRRLEFASKNEMDEIFESCEKVQGNINTIDKKLEKSGKRVSKKLLKLDSTLQRVMKVNFLPQEFIFDEHQLL